MDSRNWEKSHHFPPPPAGRVRLLGNEALPVYLVRGDRCSALVETGISATADDLCRRLDRLGTVPAYVVVTHPHADHVAGLAVIRDRFPAIRVLAGEGAAAFLSRPRVATAARAEERHMAAQLAAQGWPGRHAADEALSLAGATVCRDGAEVDLGGVTLRFRAVGGHAPGNLTVFIPEEGALLASDSLGFPYRAGGFFPLFFTGFGAYMTALEGLESLRPERLGLGHCGWIAGAGVGEAFARARCAAAELRERLRRDTRDDAAAAGAIFAEFYRDELTLYSAENIGECCRLLLRRSREEVG
ncbi:MAG: MBL fold metallo-hydrolase [Syntrophales bacterium]